MFENLRAKLLCLLFGSILGAFCMAVHFEMEKVETNLALAVAEISTLEVYSSGLVQDMFCSRTREAFGGLSEINVIVQSKPILDWLRPGLREEAAAARIRMQKLISKYPEKFNCDKTNYLVKENLRGFGYSL